MSRRRCLHGGKTGSILGVVVAMALAGCGGSGADVDLGGTSSLAASAAESDDTDDTDTDDGTDDDDAVAAGSSDTGDAADDPSGDPADSPDTVAAPVFGLPELALVTLPSDDQRPLLEWEAAPGATVYSVAVFAPSGIGYWAWRTDGTSVHLGGDPRLRDEVSGPSSAPGMTWSVIAFDAAGMPIAASVRAPLHS